MTLIPDPWLFDSTVADVYEQHVHQHIPLYEETINFCLDYAQLHLASDAKILDFGCATGCTLRKLHKLGFENLWGVDTSPQMYQPWDDGVIHYSTTLVNQPYDLILCNWTLHFNETKWSILDNLNRLSTRLIVSDKTKETLERQAEYEQWKMAQGVSLTEVLAKNKSLKGLMHLDWVGDYCANSPYSSQIVHSQLGFYTLLFEQ